MKLLIVFIVLGLVLGLVVYYVFKKKKQVLKKKRDGTEKVEVDKPSIAEILQATLIRLNIKVRVDALPRDVIDRIEAIIDKLIIVLPPLNHEHSTTTMTIMASKIASDYVPKVVKEYSELSPASQEKQKSEFIETLAGIEKEIDRYIAALERKEVTEFTSEKSFLKGRFEQKGISV